MNIKIPDEIMLRSQQMKINPKNFQLDYAPLNNNRFTTAKFYPTMYTAHGSQHNLLMPSIGQMFFLLLLPWAETHWLLGHRVEHFVERQQPNIVSNEHPCFKDYMQC